eukprot:6488129-Amphidinium_carterae.1
MGNLTTGTLALPPPPQAQTQQSSDTELTLRSRVRRLMNQGVLGASKSGDGPRPLTTRVLSPCGAFQALGMLWN